MVNPMKFVAQALMAGANVIGRAFIQSYNRVAMNPSGMKLDEAKKILNVVGVAEKDVTPSEFGMLLTKRYNTLYKANGLDQGGSFYLQSKIFRAKEVVAADFETRYGITLKEAAKAAAKNTPKPAAATEGAAPGEAAKEGAAQAQR